MQAAQRAKEAPLSRLWEKEAKMRKFLNFKRPLSSETVQYTKS